MGFYFPSLPRRGYRGGYNNSTAHLNPLPMRGEGVFNWLRHLAGPTCILPSVRGGIFKHRPYAKRALLRAGTLPIMEMINKLGMVVMNSPRVVREELLQGTGAVMAEGCSIFVEASNVKDKQITVFRSAGKGYPWERKSYDVERFDQAWQQFDAWRLS